MKATTTDTPQVPAESALQSQQMQYEEALRILEQHNKRQQECWQKIYELAASYGFMLHVHQEPVQISITLVPLEQTEEVVQ